jgi:hypothetical protein
MVEDKKWCLYVNFIRKFQLPKPGQKAKPTLKAGKNSKKGCSSVFGECKRRRNSAINPRKKWHCNVS